MKKVYSVMIALHFYCSVVRSGDSKSALSVLTVSYDRAIIYKLRHMCQSSSCPGCGTCGPRMPTR